MYRSILAGVDLDHRSRDAAALAEALAEACDADLLLVSAYQDPLLPFPLSLGGPSGKGDARTLLGAVRPGYAPRAHTTTVADVSPSRALRRLARREHADLVVIGSGGEGRPGCVHLGRTGRHLLQDLGCSLGIAAQGIADGDFALRRIAVGVDRRPESHAALAVARELATAAGAQLTVVGVADDSVPLEYTPVGMVSDLARWDEIMDARRQGLLHHLEEAVGPDGPPIELRTGSPGDQLALASDDADLLVLGARHHTTADRLALGGATEALCERSGCSLLLVPGVGAP